MVGGIVEEFQVEHCDIGDGLAVQETTSATCLCRDSW